MLNIIKTISDAGMNTKFNGTSVYGSTLTISVGTFSAIGLTVGTIATSATQCLGLDAAVNNLSTDTAALAVQTAITAALDSVSSVRASIGAAQQQLSAVSNSLGIQSENFTAAYSQIRDANISDEVVNLTKFQILNQSGTNALSQANQSMQSVLRLLQ